VDVDSDFAKLCIQNLNFLKEEDLVEAENVIASPEKYVFNSILEW